MAGGKGWGCEMKGELKGESYWAHKTSSLSHWSGFIHWLTDLGSNGLHQLTTRGLGRHRPQRTGPCCRTGSFKRHSGKPLLENMHTGHFRFRFADEGRSLYWQPLRSSQLPSPLHPESNLFFKLLLWIHLLFAGSLFHFSVSSPVLWQVFFWYCVFNITAAVNKRQ